jgi:CHAD domain-containing protein
MAYCIESSDPDVHAALRRIAGEQISKALAQIDDPALDQEVTVHQVRKRCKKLRGLIRLVRPVFKDYAKENAALRDAARALAPLRDSAVILATYDGLMKHFAAEADHPAFSHIRRRLTLRRQAMIEATDAPALIGAFRDALVVAGRRAESWKLKKDGFTAVRGGLLKTYARACAGMEAARKEPTGENLHEWRKRVKYHGFHARLLGETSPVLLSAHAKEAGDLADTLGAHHDVAVLMRRVLDKPENFVAGTDIRAFCAPAAKRQDSLAAKAFEHGAQLLAEPPEALVGRFGAYWDAFAAARQAEPA